MCSIPAIRESFISSAIRAMSCSPNITISAKPEESATSIRWRDYVQLFLVGQTYAENGSWGEHVTGWLAARDGDPRFLLVRYEALLSNSVGELDRIASFLGISATSQRLADVMQLSSVDRMRELEAKQSDASSLMKGSRKDVPFVRSAKSEGWRSDLPDFLVEKIEAAWGPVMRYLGYDLRFPLDPKILDAPDFVLRRR